jgi:ppGpp synthetase/RelA/SpoT-type nucleotidyltranferase
MKWAVRQYSKGRIDRAGEELISLPPSHINRVVAEGVIDNWRSSHAFPLQIIKMNLLNRARRIDSKALVAQRLKRLPSISLKLKHNPNMRLSQMQDIGGCRAVLSGTEQVDELQKLYEISRAKNPNDRPILAEKYDYIAHPKEDGYRSIHLIYKYRSASPDRQCFNGQRIEIQIRSSLQHAWATAVETSQTFTGQALKSKIKTASQAWLRFFALMGSAIAAREGRPIVPGTPENSRERTEELIALARQERIVEILDGWHQSMELIGNPISAMAYAFLLVLDPKNHSLTVSAFDKEFLDEAQQEYLKKEEQTESDPDMQVVLVSVESVDALRRAYPNYYADSSAFIEAVRREIA